MTRHAHSRPADDRGSLKIIDHAHGTGRPHGHNGARFVRDVRTCPRCFGPMVQTFTGKDDRGRYERWRCLNDCRCLSIDSARQDWALHGPSEVILRDTDYAKAAVARARASRRRRSA